MNWMLQGLRDRVRFALQNPHYVAKSLYRELTYADESFLAAVTDLSPRRVREFLEEPARTKGFSERLRLARRSFQTLHIRSADLFAKKVLLQYAAIRAIRPQVVIETGIANGVSSAYLLLALEANSLGTLYSIGLDDPQFLPAGKTLGWVVPEELRTRWRVLVGDSRAVLPKLLSELRQIDVFVHDSSHTYDHMLWEYRTAYPALRPGGLLFSDDASWNTAFSDFAIEVGAHRAEILRGVGFLQKSPS